MDVKFIADYELTIDVPDQEGLTDEEFSELAEGIGVAFRQVIVSLHPPPDGSSVEVKLLSANVNGKPLVGVYNAQ